MSEKRLIEADTLENPLNFSFMSATMYKKTISVIRATPPIDPETLPIVQELREKLSRYEKAEKEGRLVELPCKIGASVKGKNENWNGTVDEFSINSDGVFLFINSGYSGYEKPEDVVFC